MPRPRPPATRLAAALLSAVLFAAASALPGAAAEDAEAACRQQRDLDLAVKACTELIDSGSRTGRDLADLFHRRGVALAGLGRLAEALVDLTAALKFDPDNAALFVERGNIRDERGDRAAALADYDRAIALDPSSAEAWQSRGVAHLRQGEPALAIADFDRALTLDPTDVIALSNRGVAREVLGQAEEAAGDWARAIELGGETEALWWQRYLAERGLWLDTPDGRMSPALRAALLACARDPAC